MRTLKAYAQAVGTQIGVGLGSALRHVIIMLNTMMKYVLKAATAFATFMQTIFGKYKGGASGIAMEGLGDAVDYADDLGNAADNAAGGLGDAADNAKQLAKDLSVLPFDELNQLNKDRQEASSGSGSGGSGAGGDVGAGVADGLLDWGDLLENSEAGKLPDAIDAWAQRIKAAFVNHDWNLLGQIVATGLNSGLKKLYDLLDPQKVSEKIDPWLNAFTTSFNSFVKWFDFDLLGRTVGRGINDVVHILNTTIEGIDWIQLGSQIASGVNGLFDEVDWDGLGTLVGNKFMMFWNTLNGFVHGFDWDGLGTSVSTFFNGVFDTINFETIADTISTGLNGAFTSLASFTAGFDWTNLVHKLARGINTFIRNFDWKGNGQKLGDFLDHLCDALIELVDDTDWEALGQGIADFLQQLPWKKLLYTAAYTLITVFGDLLKGMASTPAGKFAVAIITGIVAFKIGALLLPFVNKIGSAITGDTSYSIIKVALNKLFKKGITDAAASNTVTTAAETAGTSLSKSFATSFGSFLSTGAGSTLMFGGLMTTLPFIAAGFSKILDKDRGGNGILTAEGTGWEEYLNNLQKVGQLTSEQNDQLFLLKERLENAGLTGAEINKQMAEETMSLVSSQKEAVNVAEKAVQTGKGQTAVLSSIATETANVAQAQGYYSDVVVKGAQDTDQFKNAINNAFTYMANMKGQTWEVADACYQARTEFSNASYELDTLSGVYNAAAEYAKLYGLDQETLNEILKDEFGYSIEEVVKNSEEAKNEYKSLGDTAKTAADEVSKANSKSSEGLKSAVETIKSKLKEANDSAMEHANIVKQKVSDVVSNWTSAKDATDQFAKNTQTNMTNTSTSVSDFKKSSNDDLDKNKEKFKDWQSISVGEMVSMITKMGTVVQASQTMSDSVGTNVETMVGKFQEAFSSISTGTSGMVEQLASALVEMENSVSSSMENIHNIMSIDLTQDGYNAAQSFANGFQSVYIPTPYMYVSDLNYVSLGNGGMYIPSFGIAWYKKGGLFMGGDGQMIGIAESGRDEAVLPLEDRRAMARIGSAIADASGNNGGMNNDIADRIAEKIADVLINTRSDDNNTPMNYVELKVDSEVLARAVTKGQQKLDYRNNPTAQIAY